MANETSYLCPTCKEAVTLDRKPKRSFMGFLRIPCPACNTEFRYPLTPGYVLIYWFLLIANVLFLLSALARGGGFVPNPVGIVVLGYVVLSLVQSSRLKRDILALEATVANSAE